jgi:hypothetical protein
MLLELLYPNTSIMHDAGTITIRLYDTDIVTMTKETVVFDVSVSSRLTYKRINQVCKDMGLPYTLGTKQGNTYVYNQDTEQTTTYTGYNITIYR